MDGRFEDLYLSEIMGERAEWTALFMQEVDNPRHPKYAEHQRLFWKCYDEDDPIGTDPFTLLCLLFEEIPEDFAVFQGAPLNGDVVYTINHYNDLVRKHLKPRGINWDVMVEFDWGVIPLGSALIPSTDEAKVAP